MSVNDETSPGSRGEGGCTFRTYSSSLQESCKASAAFLRAMAATGRCGWGQGAVCTANWNSYVANLR